MALCIVPTRKLSKIKKRRDERDKLKKRKKKKKKKEVRWGKCVKRANILFSADRRSSRAEEI